MNRAHKQTNLNIYSHNVNGINDKIKRNALVDRYRKLEKGIILLQETHLTKLNAMRMQMESKEYDILSAYGTNKSKGVTIMIHKELEIKIVKEYLDEEGRIIIVDIEMLNGNIYTIVNYYAPTRNHPEEQSAALSKLINNIEDFYLENLVIGGDFNTYLDLEKDKMNTKCPLNKENVPRLELMELLDNLNIIDIWRQQNIEKKVPTWRRGYRMSRLDYIFCSENLVNSNTKARIDPMPHSDHYILSLHLNLKLQNQKGKGFWKFNNRLLEDIVYINLINNTINASIEKYDNIKNKNIVWELIKLEIRNKTIPYSIRKSKERNKIYKELNEEMGKINEEIHGDCTEKEKQEKLYRANIIKEEVESIERERAKGIIFRSHAQWVEEGEKTTNFFLKQEKRNYINKVINELETEKGIITDQNNILEEERSYYEMLYKQLITDEKNAEGLEDFIDVKYIPKINEEERLQCEKHIKEVEVLNSVKLLKNNKSPGTDGLSANFYKVFWKHLKDPLINSFNYSIENGTLSENQRKGIITLLPKKGKNRLSLKNWRPISLLNTDYKIYTKIIAERLKKVLINLINEDQTGFIKGRFIGNNIRKIEDLIQYTININKTSYMIM